ncbi:formate dehydrogenase accessory sulfurtransferase FdhD [Desulfocurvus sp. DL9XJH121]
MTETGRTVPPAQGGLDKASCRRFEDGAWRDFVDTVSPEARVVIRWPGAEPVVLWAHPHEPETLALGHARVELCPPGCVPVMEGVEGLEFSMAPRREPLQGLIPRPKAIAPDDVLAAMDGFMAQEGGWEATGCFHRAAFLEPYSRQFLKFAEDVGRHNCIDRLAGWALREGIHPALGIIFVSARVTASLAGKLAAAGFSAVVSRSAVTTAGVGIAHARRMTLAGFARPGRFTVFTDREGRILDRAGAGKAGAP